MTQPLQTTVGFRESEPFRFECATCGAVHEGIPSFGWDFPAQYLAIPETERGGRVVLADDSCVIDNEWYFIRGCLEIPVHGYSEPLNYGVWRELFAQGWMRVSTLMFATCLVWHAWVGVRDIVMDYAKPDGLRLGLQVITIVVIAAYLGWTVQILWR